MVIAVVPGRRLARFLAAVVLVGLLASLAVPVRTAHAVSPVIVQTIGKVAVSSTVTPSRTITPTIATTAGNSIIVVVFVTSSSGGPVDPVSCSDPVNATYTIDVSEYNADVDVSRRLTVCAVHNAASLSTAQAITIAWSGQPDFKLRVVALEVSGLAVGPLDQTANAAAVSNVADSGSTSLTTHARELLLGAFFTTPGATFTAGTNGTASPCAPSTSSSSYTLVESIPSTPALWIEDCVVSTPGTYSATGMLTGNPLWFATLATYVASDQPPTLTTTGSARNYTENAGAVPVDPGLTLTDPSSSTLSSATVSITSGFVAAEDSLTFTNQPGISGAYSNGLLTLTGSASPGDYQTALRSVSYSNNSDTPTTANRTITFTANDGLPPSGTALRSIIVSAVNDAPTAVTDSYATAAQTTLTVQAPGVLTNDGDVDSAQLTAILVTTTAHGTLSLSSTGGFTYTPGANYAGPDTFTYRASDGALLSSVTTVSITVSPTACVPRPRVFPTPAVGVGKLQVHVETTLMNTQQVNLLIRLDFGLFLNARVTLGGHTIVSGQTYTAPANAVGVDFTVERVTPGSPTTVAFTIVDGCGSWPTFVGGGAAAGF